MAQLRVDGAEAVGVGGEYHPIAGFMELFQYKRIPIVGFGLEIPPKGRLGIDLEQRYIELILIVDQKWFIVGEHLRSKGQQEQHPKNPQRYQTTPMPLESTPAAFGDGRRLPTDHSGLSMTEPFHIKGRADEVISPESRAMDTIQTSLWTPFTGLHLTTLFFYCPPPKTINPTRSGKRLDQSKCYRNSLNTPSRYFLNTMY